MYVLCGECSVFFNGNHIFFTTIHHSSYQNDAYLMDIKLNSFLHHIFFIRCHPGDRLNPQYGVCFGCFFLKFFWASHTWVEKHFLSNTFLVARKSSSPSSSNSHDDYDDDELSLVFFISNKKFLFYYPVYDLTMSKIKIIPALFCMNDNVDLETCFSSPPKIMIKTLSIWSQQ